MSDLCRAAPTDTDRCPSVDECLSTLLALLPRGRAWQTHDGGPRAGSILWRFWRAVARVLAFANDRICAARAEFFCATQAETRAEWLAEYGLPDDCDPFPDLCAKVRALGGSTCAYIAAVLAAAGWDAHCALDTRCGVRAGFKAGCGQAAGSPQQGILRLVVYTATSPAYSPPLSQPLKAGFKAGAKLGCGASASPLYCLIDRIAPAHALVQVVMRAHPPVRVNDLVTCDSALTVD